MKRYQVKINGVSYEIEIELEEGTNAGTVVEQPVKDVSPVVPPVQQTAVEETKPPIIDDGGEEETITSPLPGNVWKLLVGTGDKVEEGQVLLILEAMKMENEIFATKSGVVSKVSVSEGQSVNTGDLLCVIQ